MTDEQLWQAILGEIEMSLTKANFTTWFKNTSIIEQGENEIIVAVPNTFTQSWMENKYNESIIKALKKISNGKLNSVFYKVTNIKTKTQKDNIINLKQTIKDELNITQNQNIIIDKHGLNKNYTFDNFVVGKSNELAYAASKAVAQKPGTSYNPLYVYGGVGLGKTHLLQATGHQILKNFPNTKLEYVTSEQFTNQFIFSIRSKRIKEFQNKFRKIDILIIDDVQFISGKDQTQEQLFHTFNDLHQMNKQVILSSDRIPKAIIGLEQRLQSRFEWGMIVDISEPDLETKIAIIQNKLIEKKFSLDNEIINFLAENIGNNIRELEGIINRIIASYQLRNQKMNLEEIKNIIQTINLKLPKGSLTPKKIIKTVAEFYDIDEQDIIGKSRKKELVFPRQIIMYIIRKETNSSFPNIGRELGGRDHTTAMHSFSKIQKEINENEKIKNDIELIKQKLYNS